MNDELAAIRERRAKVRERLKVLNASAELQGLIRMDGRCGEPLHEGCAVLRIFEHPNRNLDDYRQFFVHAPTDIDTLLKLIEEKDAEIVPLQTLTKSYPFDQPSICSRHQSLDARCSICYPDLWALIGAHCKLKQKAWGEMKQLRSENARLKSEIEQWKEDYKLCQRGLNARREPYNESASELDHLRSEQETKGLREAKLVASLEAEIKALRQGLINTMTITTERGDEIQRLTERCRELEITAALNR